MSSIILNDSIRCALGLAGIITYDVAKKQSKTKMDYIKIAIPYIVILALYMRHRDTNIIYVLCNSCATEDQLTNKCCTAKSGCGIKSHPKRGRLAHSASLDVNTKKTEV